MIREDMQDRMAALAAVWSSDPAYADAQRELAQWAELFQCIEDEGGEGGSLDDFVLAPLADTVEVAVVERTVRFGQFEMKTTQRVIRTRRTHTNRENSND